MKRNPLKNTGGLRGGGLQKTSKPINKLGRIYHERKQRKIEWEEKHPPLTDKYGNKYYKCHICEYFGEPIDISYVMYEKYVLEHKVPKGRLSLEESQLDSNLGPAHIHCNNEKGSRLLCEMEMSPMSCIPNPNIK